MHEQPNSLGAEWEAGREEKTEGVEQVEKDKGKNFF